MVCYAHVLLLVKVGPRNIGVLLKQNLKEKDKMTEEKITEYFIPALALEHPQNPEDFNLHKKIMWALLRLYQHNDFFADLEVKDSVPRVYIAKSSLNAKALGYNVLASIK